MAASPSKPSLVPPLPYPERFYASQRHVEANYDTCKCPAADSTFLLCCDSAVLLALADSPRPPFLLLPRR